MMKGNDDKHNQAKGDSSKPGEGCRSGMPFIFTNGLDAIHSGEC